MVEKFVEEYAKLSSNEPNKIRVERVNVNPTYSEITIFASTADAGKLIGKDGKMISAIKTLISGCKVKDGISYKVIVKPIDG